MAWLASCGSPPRSNDWVEATVEVTLSEEAAGDGGELGPQTLLLQLQTRVVATPDAWWVVTSGHQVAFPEPASAGGGDAPQLVPVASSLSRSAAGSTWISAGDGAFERQFPAEAEHEERNQWRQGRIAFTTSYLLSPWLRQRPYAEWCWGDLQAIDVEPVEWQGEEAACKVIAVEPGEVWEVVLAPPGSEPDAIGNKESCLAGVLGVTRNRARVLLDRLGSMPVAVTSVRPLVEERREQVIRTRINFSGEADDGDIDAMRRQTSPPAETAAAAEALDRELSEPRSLLAHLLAVSRGEEAPPSPLTITGLCLRLSRRLRPEHFGETLAACRAAGDALIQVELARALLRADPAAGGKELEALVTGPSALTAMNVIEALAAENHPQALPALAAVLRRRQTYTDADQGTVVDWALRHVRMLSQVPPGEVVARLSPAAGDPEAPADPGFDLDFWLRWLDDNAAAGGSK